jgi:hypothetical protein
MDRPAVQDVAVPGRTRPFSPRLDRHLSRCALSARLPQGPPHRRAAPALQRFVRRLPQIRNTGRSVHPWIHRRTAPRSPPTSLMRRLMQTTQRMNPAARSHAARASKDRRVQLFAQRVRAPAGFRRHPPVPHRLVNSQLW